MPMLPKPPRPLPPGWWWKSFRLYILLGVTGGLAVIAAGVAALMIEKPIDPHEQWLFEQAPKTDATIMDLSEKEIPTGRRVAKERHLKVAFTADGKTLEAERIIEQLKVWEGLKKGDKIPIVYNPDKPQADFRLASEREFLMVPTKYVHQRIALIITGIGVLVVVSNIFSFRKELRYYSHGIELAADVEKVEEKGDEVTWKMTYIWDGREYWKRETLPKDTALVVDENGKASIMMEPGKPDHATLVTRKMYDIPPPPPKES